MSWAYEIIDIVWSQHHNLCLKAVVQRSVEILRRDTAADGAARVRTKASGKDCLRGHWNWKKHMKHTTGPHGQPSHWWPVPTRLKLRLGMPRMLRSQIVDRLHLLFLKTGLLKQCQAVTVAMIAIALSIAPDDQSMLNAISRKQAPNFGWLGSWGLMDWYHSKQILIDSLV